MKIRRIVFIALALLISISFSVYADAFPEPVLVYEVINPPKENFTIYVLIKSDSTDPDTDIQEFTSKDDDKDYNQYGWRVCYSMQYDYPIKPGDYPYYMDDIGSDNHNDYYKYVICTESGKVKTSDIFQKTGYSQKFTYDYEHNKIIGEFNNNIFIQFLITLLITLFIEYIVLLMFNFKKYRKVFFLANISTQIFLYLMIYLNKLFVASGIFINVILISEAIILTAETLIYIKFFKDSSKIKAISYAITANLASIAAGQIALFFFPYY